MTQSDVDNIEIKLEEARKAIKVGTMVLALTKKYHNDTELGAIVRKLINAINE